MQFIVTPRSRHHEVDIIMNIKFMSFHPSAGHSKGIEDMDMNAVRLCFQCELEWEDGRKDCLNPVVSNPIYDKSKTHKHTYLMTVDHSIDMLLYFLILTQFCLLVSHRGHNYITAEDQLFEPVQRFLRRQDRDLHVMWQSTERWEKENTMSVKFYWSVLLPM